MSQLFVTDKIMFNRFFYNLRNTVCRDVCRSNKEPYMDDMSYKYLSGCNNIKILYIQISKVTNVQLDSRHLL